MHTLVRDMFVLSLPVAEKILRPVIVYVFLLVALRLAGKRELAQLNPFDLIVLLTLSNTVQNAIIGDDTSLVGGLLGATTLLVLNYVLARILFKHERLGRIVEGEADVLVDRGVVCEDRLEKELLTRTELERAAHGQGFAGLDDVERAELEPGGEIAFVPKKPTPEEAKQKELLERLDSIERQLRGIDAKLAGGESKL
jgi:uncharacterized membrane protein YcaP (DUF421 family)